MRGHPPNGSDPIRPARERKEHSDTALVSGVAAGDQAALAEIYERHSSAVYGLAHLRCDSDQASDVVRQVFMQIWREPDSFVPVNSSLRPALESSAHRLAADVQRRTRPGCDGEGSEQRTRTAAGPLQQGADPPEVHDRLLLTLPRDEREAISLALLSEHNYAEVAGVLGETEGVVKQLLRTGLSRLHQQLVNDLGVSPTRRRPTRRWT